MHLYAKITDLRNLPVSTEETAAKRDYPIQLLKGVSPFDISLMSGSEPALKEAEKAGSEFVPVHVCMSMMLIGQSM